MKIAAGEIEELTDDGKNAAAVASERQGGLARASGQEIRTCEDRKQGQRPLEDPLVATPARIQEPDAFSPAPQPSVLAAQSASI